MSDTNDLNADDENWTGVNDSTADLDNLAVAIRPVLQDCLQHWPHASSDSAGRLGKLLDRLKSLPEVSETRSRSTSVDLADPLPSRIGPYRILREIGRGGMGVVYLGKHTSLGSLAAVKRILPDRIEGSNASKRFLREFNANGRMTQASHPALVRALDAGESDGVQYLATDFVHGLNLSELLRCEGKLPIPIAAEIIRQVADAIATVHASKLIHRDIKPSNVMLQADGNVRVLDLGLAMLCDGIEPIEEVTEDGQVVGTLDYIAPEQLRDSRAANEQSDIYSLGALLFRLLTRKSPYSTEQSRSRAEKILTLLSSQPRRLMELCPNAPEQFCKLVDQMLSPDPSLRPASAAVVADEFSHYASRDALIAFSAESVPKPEDATAFDLALPAPDASNIDRKSGYLRKSIPLVLLILLLLLLVSFAYYSNSNSIDTTRVDRRAASDDVTADRSVESATADPQPIRLNWDPDEFSAVGLAEFVEPLPLDEWLNGKEIITVAQDGTADFTSIFAATRPEVVKANQVIEVLDKGPYVENLSLSGLPPGAGLFSRAGTVVVVGSWQRQPYPEKGYTQYGSHFIAGDDLRLSGFRFHYDRRIRGHGIDFFAIGSGVLEDCVFIGTGTYGVGQKPDELRVFLRTENKDDSTDKRLGIFWARDNVFMSSLRLEAQNTLPVEFHVSRNLFIGDDHMARLSLWSGPPGFQSAKFVVSENVFDCRVNGKMLLYTNQNPVSDIQAVENAEIEASQNTALCTRHVGMVLLRNTKPLNRLSFVRSLVGGNQNSWMLSEFPSGESVKFNCVPESRDDASSLYSLDLRNAIPTTDITARDYMRPHQDSQLAQILGTIPSIDFIGAVPFHAQDRSKDWLDVLRERLIEQRRIQPEIAAEHGWKTGNR